MFLPVPLTGAFWWGRWSLSVAHAGKARREPVRRSPAGLVEGAGLSVQAIRWCLAWCLSCDGCCVCSATVVTSLWYRVVARDAVVAVGPPGSRKMPGGGSGDGCLHCRPSP